jgi:hypothetical protein
MALPANNRLSLKGLPVTNALAYLLGPLERKKRFKRCHYCNIAIKIFTADSPGKVILQPNLMFVSKAKAYQVLHARVGS